MDQITRNITRAFDWAAGYLRTLFEAIERGVEWTWNAIKAIPGVYQIGHAVAVVLGLYRLDRMLNRRDALKNLQLAWDLQKVPELTEAGERLEAAAMDVLGR